MLIQIELKRLALTGHHFAWRVTISVGWLGGVRVIVAIKCEILKPYYLYFQALERESKELKDRLASQVTEFVMVYIENTLK